MSIQEIANLPFTELRKHINILDDEYFRITGRRVCRTCSGDVQYMINLLKNKKEMSKFELKSPTAIYRMEKGSPVKVSQSVLTDVLAIEYLAINPERISLFKRYPNNWEESVRLAQGVIEELATEDCCDDHSEESVPCDDCMRTKLNKLKMSELKKQYPEIPIAFGMKKVELVEAIIQMKLAEAKK